MVFPEKLVIEDIIRNNKSNFCKILQSKHKEFYGWLSEQKESDTKSETIYKWLYDSSGKCKNCGLSTKFVSIHLGYREFCSNRCVNNSQVIKERVKSSFFEKYGVDNVSKSDVIKTKKKQTFTERYGVGCSFDVSDGRKKAREGLMKKYGTLNVVSVKEVRDKIQKTKLDKFYKDCLVGDRLTNVHLKTERMDFLGIDTENLQFKCKKCGHEFTSYLKYGNDPVCPMCYISSFHKQVLDYIQSLDISMTIEINSRDVIDNRELDIYIKDQKIAIECNGNYWHSETSGKKLPYYHIQKTAECEKIGIRLIHIFEDEWINKEEIVKQKLRNILGFAVESIHARKCKVKEIKHSESRSFLNKHHIQGKDNSEIRLGLFYENEIVAVMTFGGLRKSLGQKTETGTYELCRYATANNRVNGGSGKLLSYFIKNYFPKKIVTYADRRWSSSSENLYNRLGFVKIKTTKCNYWYLSGMKRLHRYDFAKHTLSEKLEIFDESLTEWENMKNNGWDRIWDCGSIKYELTIK
jgi:predicted Zn-ribbon and HTH transcriptional regulator